MPNLSRAHRSYLVAVALLGTVLLAWLTLHFPWGQLGLSEWAGVGLFLGLTVLAESGAVALPRGGVMTVAFAVDFATLLIFGPAIAAWVGAASAVVLLRRSSAFRLLFNVGQLALSLGLAGLAYRWAGGEFVVAAAGPVAFSQHLGALFLAGGVYVAVNTFAVTAAVAMGEGRPLWGIWVVGFRWMAPQFLALAPFGVLMAMVYQTPGLGAFGVALFLVPLFWARYAFQGTMDLQRVQRQTIQALCNALEAYDPYTRNHSERVTYYAGLLAEELGLSEARKEALEFAARLHDIGKCRFDWEPILSKPGRPDAGEWEVIRAHPADGSQIAAEVELFPRAARIVRAHHERLDGSGYPDGLRAEQIELAARILAVADAFEAMTAARAYQHTRSPARALAELRRCAGSQFDPGVVAALGRLLEAGQLEAPEPSAGEARPELAAEPAAASGR